jgi:AAA+ superfamily predicted ATPase
MKKEPILTPYFRAGCSVIHLITTEYQRAEQIIIESMSVLEITDCWTASWNCNSGLSHAPLSDWKGVRGTNTSLNTLTAALAVPQEMESSLLLMLHNAHWFLQADDTAEIQTILDTAQHLKGIGGHLVLIGPHWEIPQELTSLITAVPLPLPTEKELCIRFKKILMDNKEEFDISGDRLTSQMKSFAKEAAKAATGMDLLSAETAFSLAITEGGSFLDTSKIMKYKQQIIHKTNILDLMESDESLDTVGGMDNLEIWLHTRSGFLSPQAEKYGLPAPKGILLVGYHGTGKTTCAKAIANFFGLPLMRLDFGKVFNQWVGSSEARIRQALETVDAVSPCVLLMDEIDKALVGWGRSNNSDSDVTSRVVSTFLTWQSERKSKVFIVATANDISNLPGMFFRKGRFDEIFFVDLPNVEQRYDIWKIHLQKHGRDGTSYDLKRLADMSAFFSGAEIEQCVHNALFVSFNDAMRELTLEDLENACVKLKPSYAGVTASDISLKEWADAVATRAN